jgi:DNA-binding NarL/FixJ family response regulator
MRCVVVEDHVLLAELLAGMLSALPGFEVVAVTHEVRAAHSACRSYLPDLLLLNPGVPGGDALELVRRLGRRKSGARAVLVSRARERVVLPAELRPFVHSVISREDGFAVLREELERLRAARQPAGCSLRVLGPRERELFVLIGRGLRSKEIADAMGLTKASVDTYRKRIATKLCRSGADLVRLAALHGQLPMAA